jgi:hypothetical protein
LPGRIPENYITQGLTEGTYNYRLIVTQGTGCFGLSNEVLIHVVSDPVVTVTATQDVFCDGGSTNFQAFVTGGVGTISYQWQQFISGNWVSIPGATQDNYSTPILNAGEYFFRVAITQNSGCESFSDQYVITVVPDPVVTIQPNANSICSGGQVLFTSTVIGGLGTTSYQWQQYNTNTSTWTNIAGATNATYTTSILTALGTYEYRLAVTQGFSCEAVSSSVVITVTSDPVVTIASGDLFLCVGANTLINSTVTGGAGSIMYQWQQFVQNVGYVNIAGANAASYTTPTFSTPGTYSYRLLVTQNSGCETVSLPIDVHVEADPVVVVTAAENIICEGGIVTLSSVVTGGSGNNTYQWQLYNTNTATWQNIANANNQNYISGILTTGTYQYRVYVTQNSGCASASNSVIITVTPDILISGQPQGGAICIGGQIILSVTASGPPTILYQWQSSPDGTPASFINIPGASASTYNVPNLTAGTTYYRVIASYPANGCESSVSDVAVVTISPDLLVTLQPGDINECVGGTNTMTVSVSGGSGAITYQWQQSADGSSGWANSIGTGATTTTYMPISTNAGTTYYRVLVNAANNGCDQAVSDIAVAVINPDLQVINQPNDVSECVGGTNTMIVSISGGSGTISYQWQSSLDGFTGWGDVTGNGANTATYTPSSAIAGTTFYRVLINAVDNGCDQAISNNAIATIIPDLVVTTHPSNVNECIGGNNTMTVIVSGGSGDITYQWQSSSDGSSGWTDATGFGANTDTYTPSSAVAGTTYYRLLVNASNSGCDQAISNTAIAVITEDLTVTSQPTNVNECVGGTNSITVSISGGSGAITYQWQQSVDGSTGWANSTGTGATTATYTPSSAVPGTTYYRVLVNAANNGCDQAVSNNSIVNISSDCGHHVRTIGCQ